ncbi:MAG: hypothetical protein ACFB5Z_12920 [Elainellaceae cyanobacterium]
MVAPAIAAPHHHSCSHHGALISWNALEPAPQLSLDVFPDASDGWNLHVNAPGFQFAPAHAGLAPQSGEGHGHIYVNGREVSRFYGPWLHLPYLPPGGSEVAVTLNANNHQIYAVDGVPIHASTLVPTPPARVVDLDLRRGDAQPVPTIQASRGDWVELRWRSDRPVALHLHGYDLEEHSEPQPDGRLRFKANLEGRFALENHALTETPEEIVSYVEVYPN